MRCHVSLQQGMLLLEVLDVGEVFAVVVRGQMTFHFVQPQLDVLNVAVKLLLLVSLTELYACSRGQSRVCERVLPFCQRCL